MNVAQVEEIMRRVLRVPHITVADGIEEWKTEYSQTANSDRTYASHAIYVEAWARDAKVLSKKLTQVKASDISNWINTPGPQKLTSRQGRLISVRKFFKYCLRRHYISVNPCDEAFVKTRELSHEQKQSTVREPFTGEEFWRLTGYIYKQWQDPKWPYRSYRRHDKARLAFWYAVSIIGRHTGLRLSDCAKLEWASLATPGFVIVHTRKSNTRVEIPVTPELQQVLDSLPRTDPKYCFPVEATLIVQVLSLEFKRIIRYSMGLSARAKANVKSFHSLRHAFGSEVYNQVALAEAQKQLGHSSPEVTKGYLH